MIDHSEHRYEFLKKSASCCRQALTGNLVPLKALQTEIMEAGKSIQDVKRNVSVQGAYISEHVDEKFQEIFEALKKRKEELLSESTRIIQEKMETLDLQEKELQAAVGQIERVIRYAEKTLELVTNEEMVTQYQLLLTRADKEVKKQKGLSLIPSEVPNLAVSVNCIEEVVQACQTNAKVYLFPIQSSDIHTTDIGVTTTHYIIDHSDESNCEPVAVNACLKSLVDGSSIPVKVTLTGKGLFEVTYTPKIRGRHELTVKIGERMINGSPFLVFVKIPPSQLGEPVMVIQNLRHPYSVAFDTEQHLLVTESGGQAVKVFKKDGPSMEMKEFAKHKIESPTGLALDTDGNIYIANVSSHTVSKYNREGQCIKVVGREGSRSGEFSHPSGLAVIDQKLYICDRNNSRIQVFSCDLEFLQSFGSHGTQNGELHWPYEVVEGEGGLVYVTDCDNDRVQTFDREGHFVHAFNTRGGGRSSLKRPVGACLGRDHLLYVTEYTHHCVSVFHPDGEYIGSFGNYGCKKGDFCYPVGITIDLDGFVYVCDQGNNRIQVF